MISILQKARDLGLDASAGHTMKYLGCICDKNEFGQEKGILEESHPHDLAVLSRPKSAGHAPLRTCIATFGYLAKSDANRSYESQSDKITSVDNDTMLINDPNHNFSDFAKTTKEITGQFGVVPP